LLARSARRRAPADLRRSAGARGRPVLSRTERRARFTHRDRGHRRWAGRLREPDDDPCADGRGGPGMRVELRVHLDPRPGRWTGGLGARRGSRSAPARPGLAGSTLDGTELASVRERTWIEPG